MLNIPYSFVVIKFQPAVITSQPSYSDDFSKFYMKITSPKDPSPYTSQTLGEDTIIPIPSSGLIKLQLIPSLRYKSKGEYLVKYYKQGKHTTPFREERWVVPVNLPLQTATTQVTANNNIIQLNYPIFEVVKVEPELPYIVTYDSIQWTQNLPLIGSLINVVYQPAINLDTLISLGDIRNNSTSIVKTFNNY